MMLKPFHGQLCHVQIIFSKMPCHVRACVCLVLCSTCVHVYVWMCVCARVFVGVCLVLCSTRVRVHVWMCVCVRVRARASVFVCV